MERVSLKGVKREKLPIDSVIFSLKTEKIIVPFMDFPLGKSLFFPLRKSQEDFIHLRLSLLSFLWSFVVKRYQTGEDNTFFLFDSGFDFKLFSRNVFFIDDEYLKKPI